MARSLFLERLRHRSWLVRVIMDGMNPDAPLDAIPSFVGASPALTVTFLGTGTSTGVPMIGCDCPVCTSNDPRDKRMRPSILVTVHGDAAENANLLVDTTPEMRIQVLRAGVGKIRAALITHFHADHIFGMDDIRQFNYRVGGPIPILSEPSVLDHLRIVFSYAFRETPQGGGKPQLDLMPITPYEPFEREGVTVTPLTVLHGKLPILSFKFGARFAYVTDVSAIPKETEPHLYGLDTLVIGTVRHEPHPTHFSLGEALEKIQQFAPRRAFLTHLSHHFEHASLLRELPPNVLPAYDGLRVEIPGDAQP